MPLFPPICLYVSGSINSSITNHSEANGLFGYSITLLPSIGSIVGQEYRIPGNNTKYTYNLTNVRKGMYFSNDTSGTGRSWRIKRIDLITSSTANLLLEDVNRYNFSTTIVGNSTPANISTGYIYELNVIGLPIFPLVRVAPTTQFISQQTSRFLASSTADGINIKASQIETSLLTIGCTIVFNSATLKYERSNSNQARNSIGIVIRIGVPVNTFTFEPFGTFYEDVANFFGNSNSDRFLRDISGSSPVAPGSLIYINTSGGVNSYTTDIPLANAVPMWLYLGLSTYDTKWV